MLFTDVVRFVQKEIMEQTGIKLAVDGIPGQRTNEALAFIPQLPSEWSIRRRIIGYAQYLCATEGINAGPIDGYWGPQTEEGVEQYIAKHERPLGWKPWRDDEGEGDGEIIGTNDWPMQTQEELVRYYGQVGKNQAKAKSPYTLKIAWNKTQRVTTFSCHEKVVDSIERVLGRVLDHYGPKQISKLKLDMFGGCLNVRKMRGGTRYSTHSWGIAIDFNPEENMLKWGKSKASFAKREYNKWWDLWEEEGWVSLGRARNYDWMHVQAAKVRKK